MSDLISRQAAIDAIRTKYCSSDFMDDGVIDAFAEIIQDLPSAQPEHNYCRECKWSRCHINADKYGNTETYWRCIYWCGETDEEGFCYNWERRTDETDRCG